MIDGPLAWDEHLNKDALLDLADFRVAAKFVLNVASARSQGHETVCGYCGVGWDGEVSHEWYCPCAPQTEET